MFNNVNDCGDYNKSKNDENLCNYIKNVDYHAIYHDVSDWTDGNYVDKVDNTDCNCLITIMMVMIIIKSVALMVTKTVINQ